MLFPQIRWSYYYLDVEGRVRTALDSAVAYSLDLAKLNLDYVTDSWLNVIMDRVIVFDPAQGLLETQLWLPREWPEWQTAEYSSQIDWVDVYNRAYTVLENILPDDMNPWDVYYQYKPYTKITEFLPPFESKA